MRLQADGFLLVKSEEVSDGAHIDGFIVDRADDIGWEVVDARSEPG